MRFLKFCVNIIIGTSKFKIFFTLLKFQNLYNQLMYSIIFFTKNLS
jgi:hypothetical protein